MLNYAAAFVPQSHGLTSKNGQAHVTKVGTYSRQGLKNVVGGAIFEKSNRYQTSTQMSLNLGATPGAGGKMLFDSYQNKYHRQINRTKISMSAFNQDVAASSQIPGTPQSLKASQEQVLQQGLKTIVKNSMKAPAQKKDENEQENENAQVDFTITHFKDGEKQEDVGMTSESTEVAAEDPPKPVKLAIKPEPFKAQYRINNEDVQLDHMLLKSEERCGQTPLIAIHGMFDTKISFKKVLSDENILKKRDCYLIGLRNHPDSDWHDDNSYVALSDDIIRFADKMGIDKFTVLGHSMGGRIGMHTACRYPDRVEGVISLDSTPFHWNKLCYVFTVPPYRYLCRMWWLEKQGFTRQEATDHVKQVFKNQTSIAAMFIKLMDRRSKDKVKWNVNVKSYHQFFDYLPTGFNDALKYNKDTVYHLRGGYRQFNSFFPVYYTKVFPNFDYKNFLNDMWDSGHFIHLEKPEKTVEYLNMYLDDMDMKIAKRNAEAQKAFSTTKAVQAAVTLPAWAQ